MSSGHRRFMSELLLDCLQDDVPITSSQLAQLAFAITGKLDPISHDVSDALENWRWASRSNLAV